MIGNLSHAKGVTLLEMMLVLTIGSAIIVLGMQQYTTYRRDQEIFILQANVDKLFQAMQSYYRINCYGTVNTSGLLNPGKLNPASSPNNPAVIDLNTDIISQGFLATPLTFSPIVDNDDDAKYVLQYNLQQSDRLVCVKPGSTKDPVLEGCTTTAKVGKIYTWQSQVAVKLYDEDTAPQYRALLGGDCLSSFNGTSVTPCSASPCSGDCDYVVWQRSPSSSRTKTKAYEWLTTPTVTQFQRMYTTNEMVYLLNQGNNQQYFLCGG